MEENFVNTADLEDIENDPEYQLGNHSQYQLLEGIDSELNTIQDTETSIIEDTVVKDAKVASKSDTVKYTKLPIARIKNIMKMDPDVNLINSEAAFLVTKATELFLETIAKETYISTSSKKRKTIVKKDLDYVIDVVDCLCFLEGAMDY